REVHPAPRSGGPDEEEQAQLAVDGSRGRRARRARLRGGGDAMSDAMDPARSVPLDGRNIDQHLGALRGEGALQRIGHVDEARPFERRPWRREATADDDSYYGLPLLKASVWKWPVPTAFYG